MILHGSLSVSPIPEGPKCEVLREGNALSPQETIVDTTHKGIEQGSEFIGELWKASWRRCAWDCTSKARGENFILGCYRAQALSARRTTGH